jgi:hypothetical protein
MDRDLATGFFNTLGRYGNRVQHQYTTAVRVIITASSKRLATLWVVHSLLSSDGLRPNHSMGKGRSPVP